MIAQELKQYDESLTVKELIEILENEEAANLTEAKERQSNVQKWIEEVLEQKYYKQYDKQLNSNEYCKILSFSPNELYENHYFIADSIDFRDYSVYTYKNYSFNLNVLLHSIKIEKTMIPITKEEYESVENAVQALINSHIK